MAVILLIAIILPGCFFPPATQLSVTLTTPQNNSSLDTLTPNFSWNASSPADMYNLQVATDFNFQKTVVDESGLDQPFYSTPSGVLNHGQTYYWRVNAIKQGQVSDWSMIWSFQTGGAATASITVEGTLDGQPWSGKIDYTITGANSYSNSTVPTTFNSVSTGSYTISYKSGGPSGASLSNISPAPNQNISSGESVIFTFNFHKQAAGIIQINVTLNGSPWTGKIDYTINGPVTDSNNNVPYSFSNMPQGDYTLVYNLSLIHI